MYNVYGGGLSHHTQRVYLTRHQSIYCSFNDKHVLIIYIILRLNVLFTFIQRSNIYNKQFTWKCRLINKIDM